MAYKNLIYETKGVHVTKVTINRPNVLNAVDYPTIMELKTVSSEISGRPDIRVVVITGSGEKSFIVGADQQEIKLHAPDEQRAKAFEERQGPGQSIDLVRMRTSRENRQFK